MPVADVGKVQLPENERDPLSHFLRGDPERSCNLSESGLDREDVARVPLPLSLPLHAGSLDALHRHEEKMRPQLPRLVDHRAYLDLPLENGPRVGVESRKEDDVGGEG